MSELARRIEALIFLSPEPLSVRVLSEVAEAAPGPIAGALGELSERYGPESGLELAEIAGGWSLRTRGDLAEVCDRLRARPPDDRLSPAALETLAVVAYLEPIGRPEVSRLRGVQVDGTMAMLIERGLIEEAGRPEGGGAMRFRTTRTFQERFGLRGREDLPPIERFELTGPEAEAIRARLADAGLLGEAAVGD
jgi:segregation and condensation protein B